MEKLDSVYALIQARMGSSRFPGKTLYPLLGKPLLQHQIERLKKSKKIDGIMIVTSELKGDDALVHFCEENGIGFFRGSETDVLARFYGAAKLLLQKNKITDATLIRLTGDCPLTDPYAIDDALEEFSNLKNSGTRYFGYHPEMPDGMDFEIFTMSALEQSFREAKEDFDHEHVTPYMWKNPDVFVSKKFYKKGIIKGVRFSVDYPEDIAVVEKILVEEKKRAQFLTMEKLTELLISHPEILEMNSKYTKNEGLIKSALAERANQILWNGVFVPRFGIDLKSSLEKQHILSYCERTGVRFLLQNETSEGITNNFIRVPISDDVEVVSGLAVLNRQKFNFSADKIILLSVSSLKELSEALLHIFSHRFA